MTRFFHAEDGARLAYLASGAGPVVLCLAGLTRGKEDFDEALPALAGCHVVRMDYRGRGESDWTGASTYKVAQEAKDALALMDHLGIERFAVLGTSRGGLIGLNLLAQARERLMGLCLNDIGPEVHRPGLARIKDYIGKAPLLRSLAEVARYMPAVSPGFRGVSAAQWQAQAARLFRETPEGLALPYDPALRDSFLSDFEAPPVDVWPLWQASAGLPVALIRGVNSDLLTFEIAQKMAALRPDLIWAEVPDRAHVPFLDEPEAVALIRRWREEWS